MLRRRTLLKRWEGIALTFLAVGVLALSGCGGGSNGTTQAQTEAKTTTGTQTTGQTETETTDEATTEATGETETTETETTETETTETETTSTETTETTETETTSANTISAERYVASICSSLTTWRRQIEQGGKKFAAANSATTSPASMRDSFVAYLDDIIASNDRLVGRVSRAGTPDVASGAQVAAALESSLRKLESIFVRFRTQVKKLPVADAARLNRRLQAINDSLLPQFVSLTKSLERLSNSRAPALRRAVRNSPACAGLRA